MKKGEQAWNCYGNRNNLFLLINYGFCFQDNLYDSFEFYVNIPKAIISTLTPNQMIALNLRSPATI